MRYWKIEAAYVYDLEGHTSREIATSLELAVELYGERSRSADRYVGEGRQLLKRLGAWPWTLADGGRLPAEWHMQRHYAVSLARWHWEGWERGYLRHLAAMDWAGGDCRRWRRVSPAEIWRVYRTLLDEARERGENSRQRGTAAA